MKIEPCDWCQSTNITKVGTYYAGFIMLCNNCKHEWEVPDPAKVKEFSKVVKEVVKKLTNK